MPEHTPRVVFDCNVFVQGIANRRSAARAAMRLFFDGEISLFVSEAILREVRDVLAREELRRKLPAIKDRLVNALFLKLEGRAILTTNVPEEYQYDRDPDDEKYLNLAIVSNASYLVSKDDDLLDLMSTDTDVARRFRTRYPFLQILTAGDFVAKMKSQSTG
jgi:putative PIN family toxin of toxin-antitoxin system